MIDSLGTAPRPSIVRALCDYNPFYLLSALCMLAGLFALNDSLRWSPLPIFNLLALIIILNVYEFLLIAIAVFLARRGLVRDVITLLALEAFFLADAGFLNSEAFTQDFHLGLAVNLLLFVLAIAKLMLVFLGLRLPLTDSRFYLILIQMFILLAIPGALKWMGDREAGWMTPMTLYIVWWVVGIVPMLYPMLMGRDTLLQHRGIVMTFIALPAISILAHLCTSNWVYNVRWQGANLSPLILGLSAAIGASDWHVRTMTTRVRTHLLLPLVAIFMSLGEFPRLEFMLDGAVISPLRLTLVWAAIVYWYGMFLHHHIVFGVAGILCIGMAGMGHSPEAIRANNDAARSWVIKLLRSLIPRTVRAWGILSVMASFVLLGLGLILSLFRLRAPEPTPVLSEEEAEQN